MKYYLVFFFFVLLLLHACNTSEHKELKIDGVAVINISGYSDFDPSFFETHLDDLQALVWNYSDGILKMNVCFPEQEFITLSGYVLKTDFESKTLVKNVSDTSLVTLKLLHESAPLVLHLKDGVYEFDFSNFLSSMEMPCCSNSTMTKSGDSTPRCIDYNGPLGNGQNDQVGVQELINFIGSDCNIAVMQGLCWGEHSNENGNGGCYNTHGGVLCTDLIQ